MPLDRSKYWVTVIEGSEGPAGRLTEVRITRTDGEPINEQEQANLKSELSIGLPPQEYRLAPMTTPAEDNVSLHVYVSLQISERIRRTGRAERKPIPEEEIVKKLQNQWYIV